MFRLASRCVRMDVRPGDDLFRDEIDALIRERLEAWEDPTPGA